MTIYISTLCLANGNNMFQVLETYARAGLRNVELNKTETSRNGIDGLSPDKFKQYALGFIAHNFPHPKEPFIVSLTSQDPMTLKRSRDQIKKAIEFCHSLGIRLFTFHAGFRVDPNNKVRRVIPYDTAFATLIESIDEISSYARQMGVKIAVENNVEDGRSRFPLLYKAEEFERLWQKLPSTNVGILVDLGHVKATSHCLGFDKYEFIDKVKDRVFAFHLNENNGQRDEEKKLDETSWCFEVIGRKCFTKLPVVLEATKVTIDEITQQVSLIGKSLQKE